MPVYAIYPKGNLSMRNFKESIVPHLLKSYAVNFPNQVWSIDMLYISYTHGHMYLNSIIDWYSRKIVGHYLSGTLDTESAIRSCLIIEKLFAIFVKYWNQDVFIRIFLTIYMLSAISVLLKLIADELVV